MKSLILIAIMFLTSEAFASDVFICHQIMGKSSTEKEVKVIFLEDITDQVSYGDNFDFVNKVVVEIREVNNGVRKLLKKFTAVAKSEDVIYQIATPDFSFIRYYDEQDQDHMSFKTNHKFEEIRLNCQDI